MANEHRTPPGTVLLSEGPTGSIVYQPQPSDDPEDPLNWSGFRKALNFGLVLSYVLFTFVILDVPPVAYGQLVEDLGFTFHLSTVATALNFAGLAVGCVLFIPFTYRYGRRPIYLLSLAIQLLSTIWGALLDSNSQILGSSFFMGIGGAISETIVQITIVDLFFVHQYATTNGIFLFVQGTGAYLGPVAAGYIVQSQGWRWMWWWCVIFLGATFLIILFAFEETTYTPATNGIAAATSSNHGDFADGRLEEGDKLGKSASIGTNIFKTVSRPFETAGDAPSKPLRRRLALVTNSSGPISHHFLAPFVVLVTFPAVAYTAITFGSVLAWFAVLTTVMSTSMIYPPYNFSPSGIGLMSIAPFIGQLIGGLIIAPMSDKWIVRSAKRNGGTYEPEMRLWLAPPGGVLVCAGVLMFGIGISRSAHWAVLAVGMGIFALGFNVCLDIALAYLADCYPNIIGDALVAVVFVRNAISVIILFCLSPWLDGMGLQNTFILIAVLGLFILMIPFPLIRWGKKARIMTIDKYEYHSLRQPSHR